MVIYAPKFAPAPDRFILLHGPIKGAPSWHGEAIHALQLQDAAIPIACPRRQIAVVGDLGEKDLEIQIRWVLHFMTKALSNRGVVMFWLPCPADQSTSRPYAQNSRIDLGICIQTAVARQEARLVVGMEEGFPGGRIILRTLQILVPHIRSFTCLKDTCNSAIELYRNHFPHG